MAHDEPFAAFLSSALRQAVDKHGRGGFVPNLQATKGILAPDPHGRGSSDVGVLRMSSLR
jgi:hypothetical protein